MKSLSSQLIVDSKANSKDLDKEIKKQIPKSWDAAELSQS